MRKLLLLPLLLTVPASLSAQRMGFTHFSGHPTGFNHSGFTRNAYARAGYAALPLYDPLYSDYFPGYSAPPEPQLIVLQPAPAATPQPSSPPAEPLMIELQGDRYVQISGDANSTSQMIDRIPAQHTARSAALDPPPQHASTVLVFRDGHREEIADYTIADGLLYASADPYTSGAWTRKITLVSLNLPETLAANQSRAVTFRIPSAPNEVIVGP